MPQPLRVLLRRSAFALVFGLFFTTYATAQGIPNIPPQAVPEINVQGNGQDIASGSTTPSALNSTTFAARRINGGRQTQTFTIENTGGLVLTLGTGAVSITGPHASDFFLATSVPTAVDYGTSSTFGITFMPTAAGTRTATVSIANDDSDENPYTFAIEGVGFVPEISIADVTVDEDAVNAALTVRLSAPITVDLMVDYALVAGTAQPGSDYVPSSGTLMIPAGETTASFTIQLVNDGSPEETETLTVQLSSATVGTITRPSATVTITDADVLTAEIIDAAGNEDSPANILVQLSAPTNTPITFDYVTRDGTATAGSDYFAAAGTAVIDAGEDVGVIGIDVIDDDLIEETETFELVLSGSTGGLLDGAVATFSIVDNDVPAAPTLSDALAQPDGTEVTFEATVTRAKGAFIRVQDATGAITIRQTSGDVFERVASGAIAPGDRVRVTGTLSAFRELRQINGSDLASFDVLASGAVPAPAPLTLAELVENAERFESALVRIEDLRLAAPGGGGSASMSQNTFEAATSYAINAPGVPEGIITLRIGNEGDTDLDGQPIPTGLFTYTGVVGQFSTGAADEGYQLLPILATDIEAQGTGGNQAPGAATLITPADGAALEVASDAAGDLDVTWQVAADPDADTVTYEWQVSLQQDFASVLTSISTGETTTATVTLSAVDGLLADAGVEVGGTAVLYHRVVTSDGQLRTEGPARTVSVTRRGPTVVEASSLAEARALANGTLVQFSGVVTRARGAFLRVQDETGGLSIRQTSGDVFDRLQSGQINPGDRVTVTGTLSEFRFLKQINGSDLVAFDVTSTGDVPMPLAITLAELVQNGERYESVLVSIPALRIPDASGTFEAATTYALSDPGQEAGPVTLRTPNAADTEVAGLPIPSGAFRFEGVVGQFSTGAADEGYQLLAVEESDIEPSVVSSEGAEELPRGLVLHGNYPNPFNPSTSVMFELPSGGEVTLTVLDVTGRQVAEVERVVPSGSQQSMRVEMGGLPSGVYVYRLQATSGEQTWTAVGRMMLIK